MPTQNRLQNFCRAFVGNRVELNARFLAEFFNRQMRCGASAGVAVFQFAGIGFGERHHFFQGFKGRVHRRSNAKGVTGQASDVRQIFDRVKVGFLHVGQTVNAQGQLGDGVTIGLGAHHGRRTQNATRAGFVLAHHRHTQSAAGTFCKRTQHAVAGTTRSPRHDQGDGFVGKFVLCPGSRTEQRWRSQTGQHTRHALQRRTTVDACLRCVSLGR